MCVCECGGPRSFFGSVWYPFGAVRFVCFVLFFSSPFFFERRQRRPASSKGAAMTTPANKKKKKSSIFFVVVAVGISRVIFRFHFEVMGDKLIISLSFVCVCVCVCVCWCLGIPRKSFRGSETKTRKG